MFPAEKKGEWEPYRVREKTITVKRRIPKPPPSPSPEPVAAEETSVGDHDGDEKMGEGGEQGNGEAAAATETEAANDDKKENNDGDVEMEDAPEVKKEDGDTARTDETEKKEDADGTASKPTEEQSSAGQSQPQQTESAEKQETEKQASPPPPQSVPDAAAPPEKDPEPEYIEVEEQQTVFQEDPSSEEGAVFPIRNGAIVNWPCFFAVLTHIYNTLSPPFHTPIIMIAQPCWTLRDREIITQFIFEKFKTPAFCLLDSALAVCYAYGVTTATVIDVGHGKVDVTAVVDSIVHEHGRGIAVRGCGGDAMTERLYELLQSKGFSREMCEQLKRSHICEILSADTPIPGSTDTASLIAATAEAEVSKIIAQEQDTTNQPPLDEDDEGVLNVAAIVTGNTSEILAQKEREKAERLAAKKGAAAEAAARSLRLPNSKKETNTFQYSSYVPVRDENGVGEHYVLQSKDVEVGQERFKALTPSESDSPDALLFGILETIAAQVYHTIMSVPEINRRGELWDSIIIVGNGSKIKGEYHIS